MEFNGVVREFSEFLNQYNRDQKDIEFTVESLFDWKASITTEYEDLLDWYYKAKNETQMKVRRIPLSECKEWSYNEKEGSICHSSGEFFRVEGFRVEGSSTREVSTGWDQPLLTQEGFDGGILGIVRKKFDSIPHYLVELKEEPGNFNIVQISPTVQATFSNLKRAHKGKSTNYSDLFLNPELHPVEVILDQWMSEDGGRLYNKRNRSMLIEFDSDKELDLISDRFKWMTLFQIKKMIVEENAIIAPHIRGIFSGL